MVAFLRAWRKLQENGGLSEGLEEAQGEWWPFLGLGGSSRRMVAFLRPWRKLQENGSSCMILRGRGPPCIRR
ncbi:unnamed protein product [Staurois parvus]|uniref:Uncharacterized protein n=1 Tax=Staurois parvus TaxID=386267 RepID=A0ABN9GII9_9NEOB|nr:unnamed protein product [Staurois parvus]